MEAWMLAVWLVGCFVLYAAFAMWLQHRRTHPKQTSWIYCPECRVGHDRWELISGGVYVGASPEGLEVFDCARCRTVTLWDFDVPVPLLLTQMTGREADELRASGTVK